MKTLPKKCLFCQHSKQKTRKNVKEKLLLSICELMHLQLHWILSKYLFRLITKPQLFEPYAYTNHTIAPFYFLLRSIHCASFLHFHGRFLLQSALNWYNWFIYIFQEGTFNSDYNENAFWFLSFFGCFYVVTALFFGFIMKFTVIP